MHTFRPVAVPLGIALLTTTALLARAVTMTEQNAAFPKPPGIERLDPALDRLVAPDAAIEVLAGGYDWTEGPVWVKDGGYLLFSDIPPNRIHRWKEGEGAKLYLTPSGYTGIRAAWRRSRLERVDPRSRGSTGARAARRPPHREDGRAAVQAAAEVHDARRSLRREARFNSPNDWCSAATATSTSPIPPTAWRSSGTTRSAR